MESEEGKGLKKKEGGRSVDCKRKTEYRVETKGISRREGQRQLEGTGAWSDSRKMGRREEKKMRKVK